MSGTIQSLYEQLAAAEENLRLIQGRKAEYVLETDIPLQVIKDERRLEAQIADLRARLAQLADLPCPYRGLFAFREQDAPFFFGREAFTERLVEAVQGHVLTAVVVGPSGSGKSSVVFAGLLPRLRQADASLPLGEGWAIVQLRPGSQPFDELANALLPLLEPGMTEMDRLIEIPRAARAFQQGELALHRVAERILEKSPEATRLLMMIDQFEELYTLCPDPDTRHAFLDCLLQAISPTLPHSPTPLHLLLTLRADFMGQALAYRPFADALDEQTLMLGPMTREELEAAIVRPAERQGVTFEKGLVARILDDVGSEPGNLPLLEFALTQLWERQESGRLTHVSYKAIGKVEGALMRYADQVYGSLSETEQEQARRIFVQLVRPGEGTEDTRRLAARAELDDADWALVQQLADARLVVTSRDPAEREVVEVAHEALIQGWERLQAWMDEDRTFRVWQERLRAALRQWEASGRDVGALLRGVPLAEAKQRLAERSEHLGESERAFIRASAVRANRIRWLTAGGVILAFLVISLLALIAWGQKNEALDAQAAAEVQRRIALARQLGAQALNHLNEPDLALLLSLEANRIANAAEVRGSLLAGLQSNPCLISFMHGHTDDIGSIVFSPDGKTLASGSADGTIILWDVATVPPVGQPFAGHIGEVSSVAFSPDGKMLASGSADGTIILWDVVTGQPVGQPLVGHRDEVNSVVFSPDGQKLASGGRDNSIILWDVASRQPIGQPFAGHTYWVWSVVFSPDGRILASGSADGTIILWNVATGQAIGQPFTGHTDGVHSVAFSPDGQMLASGSWDRSMILWDVATGQPSGQPLTGHINKVLSVAFSPDGQTLASGSADNTIILWDVAKRQLIGQPRVGHTGWVNNVTFSPDGQTLASGSADNTIILWNVKACHRILTSTDEVLSVAFSPDGQVLASGTREHSIILWDVMSGQQIGEPFIGHTDWVWSVAFSPDGKKLASGSRDDSVRLWDVATRQHIGQPLIGHKDDVRSVAFSPDGKILASSSADGTIILWDVATGQPIGQPLAGHIGEVLSVAFSPDGNILASGSADGTIILRYVATGQLGQSLTPDISWIHSVAFSPDGRLLASGSADGSIILWDVATGQPVGQPLVGHRGEVNSVVFSPDGQKLASGGRDNSIILWDIASGQPIGQPFTDHVNWVWSVVFSPDGQILASGSADGAVILWDVSFESWQTRACSIANRNLTPEEWRAYLGNEPYRHTCPK